MENLMLSFNVVAPLFLLLCVGFLLKRLNMISDATEKQMNNLVFRCFLPTYLFYSLYTADRSTSFQPKLVLYCVCCVVAIYVVFFAFIVLTEKENPRRGVMIQGMFRGNTALYGLPVTVALFGEEWAGLASVAIGVVVPLINVLSVVVLEIFRGGTIQVKKILRGIVTNPLVIASALGGLMLLSGWKLPHVVELTASNLAKVATPLSFVVLGSSFRFSDTRKYRRQLAVGLCGKLIVYPALALGVAILLGFRAQQLAVLLAVTAPPTAVSSFPMAQQMGGDATLAGQLVVTSTIFSILTVFLWIFALKQLGVM